MNHLTASLLLAFASAQATPPQPAAQATPAPPTVSSTAASPGLSRALTRYADGSAHRTEFAQVYTPSGFTNARRESGIVWIQAPQKLRFDYTAPEQKVFTYDGTEGRFLSPEDHQLTVRRLSEDEKARLPIVLLTDPAELGRQYQITAERAAGLDRILLKPRTPRPDLAWLRLTIADDGSIRELSYEDGGGNRTEFQFQEWRREKPRRTEDYKVTGPPGTRILEN